MTPTDKQRRWASNSQKIRREINVCKRDKEIEPYKNKNESRNGLPSWYHSIGSKKFTQKGNGNLNLALAVFWLTQ